MRKLFPLLLLGSMVMPPAHAGDAVSLSLPPESLRQWYKPANQRQVWLHTMFNLRRSMQAVSEYAALEDGPRLEKWATRFAADYRRIVEMVPEWSDEVELKWADRLVAAAKKGNAGEVQTALHRLGNTCNSCHREFRPVVAALFRAPDFHDLKVESSETLEEIPYHEVMERLSGSVNRIRIAMEDGRGEAARQAADRLRADLQDLGNHCTTCHEDKAPRERILGAGAQKVLDALSVNIEKGEVQEAGKRLGQIGVEVCSRCHGTHRTLADLRGRLLPDEH